MMWFSWCENKSGTYKPNKSRLVFLCEKRYTEAKLEFQLEIKPKSWVVASKCWQWPPGCWPLGCNLCWKRDCCEAWLCCYWSGCKPGLICCCKVGKWARVTSLDINLAEVKLAYLSAMGREKSREARLSAESRNLCSIGDSLSFSDSEMSFTSVSDVDNEHLLRLKVRRKPRLKPKKKPHFGVELFLSFKYSGNSRGVRSTLLLVNCSTVFWVTQSDLKKWLCKLLLDCLKWI